MTDFVGTSFRVLFSGEFAKSPAAGILVGVVVLVAKDFYERWRVRRALRRALNTEARCTWGFVKSMLGDFPSKDEVDAVVAGVTNGDLTFEVLNQLPSGFLFLKPSFQLGDIISKLKPKEAEAAVVYFDVWDRLVARTENFSATFSKLLELTSSMNDPRRRIELLETADRLSGNLRLILLATRDLGGARHNLECVTADDTSTVEPDEFLCPGDWQL